MGCHRGTHPPVWRGAPLHLRIKAFRVDIDLNEARRPVLKLDVLGSIAVPRQSYLRRIDADGKRPLEDVKKEVTAMAFRYYYLVLAETTKEKHVADVAQGLLSTLDVYESFHLVQKQTDWARLAERVEFSYEDRWCMEGEDATSPRKIPPPPPPAQIPLSCTCKWN